jgi:hypothetical protein
MTRLPSMTSTPWRGCHAVGNAQYSSQFELSGGLTLGF